MRLANISNRLMLVTRDDRVVDVSQETDGKFSPDIQECYERWDELTEVAGKPSRRNRTASVRGCPGRLCQSRTAAAPNLCDRTQLRRPCSGGIIGCAQGRHSIYQVRHLPDRTVREHHTASGDGGLGGGAGSGDRPRRTEHRQRKCVEPRRRAFRWSGPVRTHHAVRRSGTPVQPREVVPGIRPDRAVAGHP